MPSRGELLSIIEEDGAHGITKATAAQASTLTLGGSIMHRDTFQFTGTVTLTANGTANSGGLTIGSWPGGNLMLLGGVGSLTITPASTNASTVSTTAAIVVSLGTALPGTVSTLTGTAANLIQSSAATLVAGTKSLTLASTVSPSVIDNTTDSKSIILNLNLASSNPSSTTAVVVSGTLQAAWLNLGDF